MVDIPLWVEALKIRKDDYLDWLKLFPSKEFVLSWAIESRCVNETAYLRWAAKQYMLPIVNPKFFLNAPPLALWKKILSGRWSPTVLPIYEWQQVIYVGVLEPANFVLDPRWKVQLVLSPSSSQKLWWQSFVYFRSNAHLSGALAPAVIELGPSSSKQQHDVIPTKQTETVEVTANTQISIEMPTHGDLAPPAEVSEFEIVDTSVFTLTPEVTSSSIQMQGSNTSPSSGTTPDFSPEADSNSSMTPESATTLGPTPETPPVPGTRLSVNASRDDTSFGFHMLEIPPDEEPLLPPEPSPLEAPKTFAPDGLHDVVDWVVDTTEEIAPEGLSAAIPQIELGQIENLITENHEVVLPELKFEDQQHIEALQVDPTLEAANQVQLADGDNGEEEIPPSGVPESPIKEVLEKLKNHFELGMVLIRNENSLKPYQWDQNWPVDQRDKSEVDLNLQSLFKIVVDTKHPYHGYARPSTPNDKFFRKWFLNKYPEHVSALPLKANNEVFGILLGVTTQEKAENTSLMDLETIAYSLSEELSRVPQAA